MEDVIQKYIENGSHGDLDIGPDVTSLPDDLRVRGKLRLRNSTIKTLPKNLQVDGSLNLSGSNITTLPDDIKIGGGIDLTHSNIRTLPDNLNVQGNLYLAGARFLEKLPRGLKIRGYLFMEHGPKIFKVEDLPGDLEVNGRICSNYFTDKEAKNYLKYYQQIKELEKKLPELEGIFL